MKNSLITQQVGHFPISMGKYEAFLQELEAMARQEGNSGSVVCMANVHMFIEAYYHVSFGKLMNEADMVAPDGKPLTWALRMLHGIRQDRVAGMDLLPDLLERAMVAGLPVYFYGGTQEMLDKTTIYCGHRYPALRVAGSYSPPFRPLTTIEEMDIVDTINKSGAKFVFVALGCPKQEKWMAAMKSRIHAVMIGIGGALPVMLGMQKRAPSWMQKTGLEWLFRLQQEPKRLFKRYAVTNTLFIYLMTKEILRIKFSKKRKWLPMQS